MSELHTTLFVLDKYEKKEIFVEKCHKALLRLGCQMEKEDTFITFNDGPNGESEDIFFLDNSYSDESVLDILTKWEFLGCIDYSLTDLNIVISVNFVTFNFIDIQFFDIGITKTAIRGKIFEKEYREFLLKLSTELGVVRYCNDLGHINYGNDIVKFLKWLSSEKFEFDSVGG